MKATKNSRDNSQAAIFLRLWETKNGHLSRTVAREVLKLRFSAKDEARMHELAEKNRTGTITADELEEFDDYITIGDLLAILQSKARQTLRNSVVAKHG
jgi:hypothetical protein